MKRLKIKEWKIAGKYQKKILGSYTNIKIVRKSIIGNRDGYYTMLKIEFKKIRK